MSSLCHPIKPISSDIYLQYLFISIVILLLMVVSFGLLVFWQLRICRPFSDCRGGRSVYMSQRYEELVPLDVEKLNREDLCFARFFGELGLELFGHVFGLRRSRN